MKKTFLIIACALAFVSCSNENLSAIAYENQEMEAMQNFKNALMSLNKPENRPTAEEKQAKDFPQISDRRKDLLVPSAIALIKSTGINDSEISKKTREDKNALINWALDIYIENSHNTKN
ncbi:hypothetical protein MUU74_02370 [Chryseobacterium daecheongense]|uniref:hypothetical protein n=1 Tax=Chryseobacterium daecheongense TaxID=192389 RepID=UPI001FD66F09|nr:hypothetical protein [Chryseobacterium daecheongense]UOU98804.1 hypothetical protein MUU74_02370 [Chryseobacterium daecheongense]